MNHTRDHPQQRRLHLRELGFWDVRIAAHALPNPKKEEKKEAATPL